MRPDADAAAADADADADADYLTCVTRLLASFATI